MLLHKHIRKLVKKLCIIMTFFVLLILTYLSASGYKFITTPHQLLTGHLVMIAFYQIHPT